jgi:S1-C subfamily serine protease
MPPSAPWKCPACDRRVPGHIDACRCGYVRREAVSATPSATDERAPLSRALFAAKLAIASVVAVVAVVGAVWYSRPTVEPAPRYPTLSPSAVPEVAPRAAARSASPATAVATVPASDTPAATAPAAFVPTPAPASLPAAPAPGGQLSIEDLVARVSPAVVIVETSAGRGSGFFVRPDTIITNAHVAGSDLTVRIRRTAGDTSTARVETVARDLDLAILRLSSPQADQRTVSLGTASGIRTGQEVVAIGSALGVLQNTVTRGIVSGVRLVGGVTLIRPTRQSTRATAAARSSIAPAT